MAANRVDYHEVFTTKTITVCPRARPPHAHEAKVIHLSNLDRKCPALMYLVFFYRSTPPLHGRQLSSASLFSSLKRGLEEAMSDWYPAAGRLCLAPPPPTGKINLACTNSGALLVEAATRATISDLGDLAQHNDFYERLVCKPPSGACFADTPLVVGQVTKFACGGYSIGVGTNHALFDGAANYSFLSAWASKTVGRAAEGQVELVEPVHERGRLLVCHGQSQVSLSKAADREGEMGGFMALDHLHQLIKQAVSANCIVPGGQLKLSEMDSTGHEHLVLRTFSVSASMVSRLKSKAASGSAGISCSSFEVVAAHLWKVRTKAFNIAKHRMVCLQFAVDARARMRPPLPKGFTGNAYVLSSVACTSAELEEASLAAVVGKIKVAKQAVTDSYVMKYLAALNAAPQVALPPLPELTMVSDWTKTPYHSIDFGIGKAVFVTPLATPFPQVAYFMQSPSEAGRVDVRIGLPHMHLQAFTRYFLSAM
ncbi:brassinosteroid-related acyltransferase 1-like isoform X1 [Musa acuminata AAA Group]|uniref:brassinosteroid-related acyltransferase 1-like isoform X1 n=2 Tax=Musa acuminata AAA Group TaxID=214697 RepID=UPI0031CF3357